MLLDAFDIIDLTQTLSETSPTWNGSCGFCLEVKKDYDKDFRVQQVKMHAGIGTHIDAPSHRFQDGISVSEILIENLIAPVCVINVSDKAFADYEISLEDIENYEMTYGMIPSGALVIGYTGWSRFWSDPDLYRNVDSEGQMHFPSFSAKAAELLLQRNIKGLAIDTLSPDCLDGTFPVHKLILGSKKYIIENIADCLKIPPSGAYVIALPLKACHATEAPIRIIGLVPKLKSSQKTE